MSVGILLLSHAIAYLTHEYSHSVTAWLLGYMPHPFALDYGGLTPANIVLLSGVGDNVQYDPILATGHGTAAAAIALAGPYVGNALLYVGLCIVARRLPEQGIFATSCLYWLMLMCAGNVWSYVPIRAITTHADIAIAANGLHVGVWTLFPVLVVPSLILVGHFFLRICPSLMPSITADQPARKALVIALTSTWFFTFFGGIGLYGSYGAVSEALSVLSAVLLMPLSVIWLWNRCPQAKAVGNRTAPNG
ncbi:hypothetical protein [Sphingomonas sp.]|uniref:hypothetical protein n=1 Tax=Sphingomonas sp. TaxID=28214 RepID=UPI003B3BDEF2